MKKITNIIVTACSLIYLFPAGSCNKKETLPINVIPVASTVGHYSILNLSDFTTDVKYIPLETNDSILVGANHRLCYENGHILISEIYNCQLFDNTGKFCRKIGQRGQGPDEYILPEQTFIHDNIIFLHDHQKILSYDMNGSLIERINLWSNDIPEKYRVGTLRLLSLQRDIFVMDVNSSEGYYPKAILLETHQSGAKMIKEYPNFVILDKVRRGIMRGENAIMYRFKDDVRTYKVINDTVFTIGQNTEMKEAFIFDLGRYKPALAFFEFREGDPGSTAGRNYIHPLNIYESLNYLFYRFDFGKYAPESVELTNRQGGTYSMDDVCGVFDKRTGKLTLMRQPIKGKFGFRNDIDGGPVIWPGYISSNNEIVTSVSVEEFLDYYSKTKNPTPQMTEIANNIQWDDNPIVIVAKLKE